MDWRNFHVRINIMKLKTFTLAALALLLPAGAASAQTALGGADEKTPSHSEYFTWINHSFEGPTEETVMAGLDFFKFLQDTYGMHLDIFALDAGTIDGWNFYDSADSPRVRKHFPNGFGKVADFSRANGIKLGMWCGPDGFGNTDEEAQARLDMMLSLVNDYNVNLFKMDACCGPLRPSKNIWVEKMMSTIRRTHPDFVLLNHRLDLGEATKYSTTYLLGGQETYIDVHMVNHMTASHNRAVALEREVPPTRLTEDHGVCISSCPDFWEDDLILQAFNRNLILAPEIYGNPWLLRDEEYSQLAYIFNLHRDYRDIMVDGLPLPEEKYGLNAMSRGDGNTRMITLRNLSWEPVTYHIALSEETGLEQASKVRVRMYHPYIYDMGSYKYGSTVDVTVLPFRSCLVKLTSAPEKDPVTVSGIPYRIISDRAGGSATVELLGRPGESYKYRICAGKKSRSGSISFPGTKSDASPYRRIAAMAECPVPEDADAIYYSTVFSADNNALEVRALKRSGETAIPQVKAARDAFFGQERFVGRAVWDKNLFDGDKSTFFDVALRWGDARPFGSSMLCMDLGRPTALDSLVFSTDSEHSLGYQKMEQGAKVYVSSDLVDWKEFTMLVGLESCLDLRDAGAFRYLRFSDCPLRLSEITGYRAGEKLSAEGWRVNNLFETYGRDGVGHATDAWKSEFVLDDIPENSYLCIAVNGYHGTEKAWAGLKVDGEYVGCPDRSPSYPSNTYECPVRKTDSNYTFYVPLTPDMKGKKIEAYVLTMWNGMDDMSVTPEIWLANYPHPFCSGKVTM